MSTVPSQPLDLQTILSRLNAKQVGTNEWKALCPAHDDHNPSLGIAQGTKGPVVHCYAGCLQAEVWPVVVEICRGNGLPPPTANNGHRPIKKLVAVYPYTDEQGNLLYSVHRFEPKDFRQENANGEPTTRGVRRVPFHLPQLIEGIKNKKAIYIVEGEKDVLNLEARGLVATCNAGGAGKWLAEFRQYFSQAYVVIVADWDDPGKKHALQIYENLCVVAISVAVKRAASGGKDVSDHLAVQGNTVANLLPVEPHELGQVQRETIGVIRLSDVEETSVEWLWQDRIPLGMMAIQDGNPDEGKSMVLMDLAARVSRDGVMPDGITGLTGNVMILASEDNLNNTIKPRLRAAGAIQERIYFLQEASIPSGIEALEQMVREHEIKLLIIDPLMAYFDEGVKVISEPSARKAMKPIGDMAERCGCAVVFNRHFNKDSTSGKTAAMRGSGSGAIGAQCRSSWQIGSFPTAPQTKYLTHGKKNLAKATPPTLKFHIESNPEGLPHIVWEGISDVTGDEIVGAAYTTDKGETSMSELDRACKWITDMLVGVRYRATTDIEDEAINQHDIAKRTLVRAKDKLGINIKKFKDGKWYWLGPEYQPGSEPH